MTGASPSRAAVERPGGVSCLQDRKDGNLVVQQCPRRQHGGEVEQQVRVALKLLRQRLLEHVLKGVRRRGGNAIPPLGRAPVVVVDCTADAKDVTA